MSYTPPAFTDVGGVILTGYTPPAYTDAGGDVSPNLAATGWQSSAFGSAVIHVTASLAPSGWTSSALGALTIYNHDHYVEPAGVAHGALGTLTVYNYHQFAVVAGITAGAFGTPTVFNFNQIVENGGWQSSVVPSTHYIFDPLQTVEITGIAAPVFPVTHYVADYYQYINLADGINTNAVGTHAVAFHVRTLDVPFIFTNAFGTPTVESFQNIVEPWRSSAFGTAFVSLRVREIAHWASTPTVRVPYPTIFNRNRYVRQRGWESLQIQPPTIYNLKQFVYVDPFYTNSPVNDLGLSSVVNRNREVRPSGFTRGRFGNRTDTFVELGARAIAPAGLDSLTWGSETFISHYIRYVYPESWDDLRMRRWAVVYNDAFLVEPVSIGQTSRFGRPDPVFSNQQTVSQYNVSGQSAFGTAFIAPRIRTVVPHGISFPTDFHPTVRLNPQIIAPQGFELFRPYGHVVLSIFQRIARPQSVNVHQEQWVGVHSVRNRNRYLTPQPVVRGEYGRARIYNRNQPVNPPGLSSLRMGPYVVDYRTRTVLVPQIGAPTISLIHRVRKSIADPPGAQVVYPTAIFIGLSTSVGVVPTPVMRHPTIYPDGWDSSVYGTCVVRTNTLRPLSIVYLDKFGEPLVSGAQWVYPEGVHSWLYTAQVPAPQLSPHTIYAPFGEQATAQARNNHPSGLWHYIDNYGGQGGKPWFGIPSVSTSPRFLTPEETNYGHPRFGVAGVELRRRFVFPSPIRGPRFGPVTILNVPQFVGFNEDMPGYVEDDTFGEHVVSRPPLNPWPVTTYNNDFSAFGMTRVELFNREILPTGIPHRGNPQQGFTNPWGDALVGYPRSYTLTVGDATLWGVTLVEYLHRRLWPMGWDSLTLVDDSLDDFRSRMRVLRRNPLNAASGIPPATGVGTPTVSFRVRGVVTNPIWPGYTGMPRVGMTITPTGWDSLEVGDIDEWEAGTVKPYGAEMFGPGYPRLARGVQPSSIVGEAHGAARMAWLVRTSGMPPVGFDGPSVTDEYGCSRRVVTVWPIQIPAFPEPVVTT